MKYIHCPQGIFDFVRLNREYFVGKEGTTRLSPAKSKRQHSKDNDPQLSRPKLSIQPSQSGPRPVDHTVACTACTRKQVTSNTFILAPQPYS